MEARAWISRTLERGQAGGALARLASRAWAAGARVERPLVWREGARVIAVGGSTLGGSGKTPLAIACADALHRAGERVALVGHAYRGRPGRPRFVSVGDDVGEVGDEALECAARLAPYGVPVVVAETRQRALDLALEVADVAVVDGLGQAKPRRASLALLAVDAASPWGAGRCPPEGDLRAPVPVLLDSADRVVAVGEGGGPPDVKADHARVVSRGAWLDGRLLDWEELRGRRLGIITAVARPDRVIAMLEARGARPLVAIHGADHHAAVLGQYDSLSLDLWLCTPKGRTHLRAESRAEAVPVATLDYALRLDDALERALRR
jgi:tetraacyldisaccharide 4'-kinase